ncbi:hypothetical protein PR202_gb07947 [Eleusine coracana subsp. coracana]|uniref:Uncharacterized protein n=1 Tax=Eleusine coracana subsp. coracana TaxID=191504 RepID=A0AAV5ED48_ELECO|nr:hypothetical protein PR202_gb07947 [Eleusine coracana subsp. coracana]
MRRVKEKRSKSLALNVVLLPLATAVPLLLSVLRRNISRYDVFIAGDALHPMMSELRQGGCAALEDVVVLTGCLGDTFSVK